MKRILYVFIQCTWGLLQTLIGLLVFIVHIKDEHHFYRFAIDTRWKSQSGLSLGLFIFTPADNNRYSKHVRVHEYGHTFQSLILGPFYLIAGIISFLWGNLPVFQRMRKEKKLPYTYCFVERWASKLGERFTEDKAIW